MDLIGAALPNLMFIVGILAIGLGLGIELKIVSLNKEIDKTGRIGAFIVGAVLIGGSILMYLNPSSAGRGQSSAAATSAAQPAQAAMLQAPTGLPASAVQVATAQPTAVPLSTAAPTAAAPAPTARPTPSVSMPNLHGLSEKDALQKLSVLGLQPYKANACTGADRAEAKPKKGRIQCQNPPAGQAVAPGSSVEYVLGK